MDLPLPSRRAARRRAGLLAAALLAHRYWSGFTRLLRHAVAIPIATVLRCPARIALLSPSVRLAALAYGWRTARCALLGLALLPALASCGPPTGSLVWRAAAGNERFIASPVVDGGAVFVASTGGALTALDAGTGKERWKQPVIGGADLPPLVLRHYLVLAGNSGTVHGFARGNGQLLWRLNAKEPPEAAPVENGGRAFVVTRGRLWALDPRRGRVLWARPVAAPRHAPPAFGDTGRVFLGTANAVLVFDPRNGRLLRTIPVAGESVAPPLLRADRLLNITGSGLLQAFFLATGREAWRLDLQGPAVLPLHADESRIYVASGGNIQAIESSSVYWRRPAAGPENLRTPLASDGARVFGVSSTHGVVALDRDTGATRWTVALPDAGTSVSLTAGDGLVYVGYGRTEPAAGGVMALTAADGKVAWRRKVEWGVRAAPAAAGQVAYFATLGGELYAVRP